MCAYIDFVRYRGPHPITIPMVTSMGNLYLFVKPACGKRDIVVPPSVWCKCMHALCMCSSGFVRVKTSTFMHGLRNYFEQLFS